jgi:RimJ/RimL family protein N-acetyltransferase
LPLQPKLEGRTIRLRPLIASDRAAFIKAGSDPAIWAQHPAKDRHEPDKIERFFDEALASGGALIIEEKATERVIGSSRYHNLDLENGSVEIGWTFLICDHWGGATNREVKALMLEHAFDHVAAVHFKIGAQNLRSRRAVEKIGARLLNDSTEADTGRVVYEIDKDSFVRR